MGRSGKKHGIANLVARVSRPGYEVETLYGLSGFGIRILSTKNCRISDEKVYLVYNPEKYIQVKGFQKLTDGVVPGSDYRDILVLNQLSV